MLKRFPITSMRWIGLLFFLGLTPLHLIDIGDWDSVPKYSLLKIVILDLVQQGYFVNSSSPLFFIAYLVLSLIFVVGYWQNTSDVIAPRYPRQVNAYLLLQVLVALVIQSMLMFILVVQLALVRPRRLALTYLVVFFLLYLVITSWVTWQIDYSENLTRMHIEYLRNLQLLFILGVVFGLAYATKEEYLARQELVATHAHVQSTQILLQESVRQAERSRIAHDVHDNLGHHLTALNLHLDLAQRKSKLDQSHELTTVLMTAYALSQSVLLEVRTVVSGVRARQSETVINLPVALRTLCAGIPAPQIELNVQESLKIHSLQLAHHVFCCIQEAITNTVKHAHARNLKIDVSSNEWGLSVTLMDDGCGWREHHTVEGNGLCGMRERVQQLGGQLYVNRLIKRLSLSGFSLEIAVPHDGRASFE